MKRSVGALLLFLACGWVATAANHDVIQKDKKFSQSEMTIHVGESVNFRNEDTVTHHLFTNANGFSFNFMQPEDQSKEVKFPVAGDFDVRCAIHPGMKLKIHVVP